MAKLKSFIAQMGMSAEIKGTWYKFHTGVEIELEEGDDVSEVKEKAWNTVEHEIEKQVSKILED